MAADLSTGILRAEDVATAMDLSVRAFFDEPFVHEIYGPEPVARFAGLHATYASSSLQDEDFLVGAFAGAALVGLVRCSPSGSCHVCHHGGVGERPPGAVEGMDWEFEGNVRRAHASQGDHGWVSRVAVEPLLHGQGIGRRVLASALVELEARGATAILLECQDHRVPFYEACGFTDVGTFPDPAGPDAHLMRTQR